jgi:rhomboid protease GluP
MSLAAPAKVSYGPRRGARRWWCIGALVLGAAMAMNEWPKPLLHVPAGARPGNLSTDLFAAFVLVCGLVELLGIIRRVPRFSMDGNGLVLSTLFRTTRVAWECLGTFSVVAPGARRGRLKATAPILAPSPAAGKSLTIPDVFEVPFRILLDDLAARHSGVAEGGEAVAQGGPVPERRVGIEGFRWPWLTAVLLAVFVAVFVAEQRLALTPGGRASSPSTVTLVALGGLSHPLVLAGQWFRLLTAPFLHANSGHLVANAIAFALAGYALERFVGRAWMFSIFIVGAFAGSIASFAFTDPALVGVGASGGIMAMLVALFMISFRLLAGQMRVAIQTQSARVVIPALIPASVATATLHIDYSAHIGGALLGAIVGVLLLACWQATEPLPGLRRGAGLLAVTAVLACGASGYAAARFYPTLSDLIPPADLPHDRADMRAKADHLLGAYPRDPRSHLFAAVARMDARDAAAAEREMLATLTLITPTKEALFPALASTTKGSLALLYGATGRAAEARAIAQEPCAASGARRPAPPIADALVKAGVCGSATPPARP